MNELLERAIVLLEEYARHDVTRDCHARGSSEGREHVATCSIGKFIREARDEQEEDG
jgi:hypothetical protein